MVTKCVYCAVRTSSSNVADVKCSLQGLTLQRSGFVFGAVHVECVIRVVPGQGSPLAFRLPSVSIFTPLLHTDFCLHVALTRKTKGRSLEASQKSMLFRTTGSFGQGSTWTSVQSLKCSKIPHNCWLVTRSDKIPVPAGNRTVIRPAVYCWAVANNALLIIRPESSEIRVRWNVQCCTCHAGDTSKYRWRLTSNIYVPHILTTQSCCLLAPTCSSCASWRFVKPCCP